MADIILKGHKIWGGCTEGEALVSKSAFGFYPGLDPKTGIVTEKGHELEGQKLTGRILVYPRGKGSTTGAYILYAAAREGTGPKAIINVEADGVVAVGAVISNIPLIDKLDQNPIEVISNGDKVSIDADNGIVKITKKP
ncbi:aconitase X swivel domain-containing protein [Thermodesulfobacteriota bacterium]